MNQYASGELLKEPSTQSILPVMKKSGQVVGFYSITPTTFDGSELDFTLPDGLVVPLSSVTLDVDPTKPGRVTQYMAALYGFNTPQNFEPWASVHFRSADEGYSRMWILPVQTWVLRYTPSILQVAFATGMDMTAPAVTPSPPPTVTSPLLLQWKASVKYEDLMGDCPFFDFNWVTLFKAASDSLALRIVSTGVPGPIGGSLPFAVQVLGIPQTVGAGVVRYDTIRIMKLVDDIPASTYGFNFDIYDEQGQVVPAILTLTVQ